MMTKRRFRTLFLKALATAAEAVHTRAIGPASRAFVIELHGAAATGECMSVDQAVDRLYLGDDKFYRIIDVAVRARAADKIIAFVRVSGHQTGAFDQTWDPSNLGPFKQILAQAVEEQQIRA